MKDDFGRPLIRCGEHGNYMVGVLICKHVAKDESKYVDNGAVEGDEDFGEAFCQQCLDGDLPKEEDIAGMICMTCAMEIKNNAKEKP